MSDRVVTTTAVLNETTDLVTRVAAPWVGILLLLTLPYRFLLVNFVDRLFELRAASSEYGDALMRLAFWTMGAYVVALIGRLIYARACRMMLHGERVTAWEPLKLPGAAAANSIFSGLFFQALFFVSSMAVVPIPIVAIFKALSVTTAEFNDRPALSAPFRTLGRYTVQARVFAGLLYTYFFALLLAFINLLVTFQLALWAAGGVTGFDLTRWRILFSLTTRLFTLLLIAGSFAAIEPFWIASFVCFVARVQSKRSGNDLRQWFRSIRRSASVDEQVAS